MDGSECIPFPSFGSTFPFSACCPTGHLAIHLGPVLLITRLGLRMRTTRPVPSRRSETSCALKRGTSTLVLFSTLLFLSPSLSCSRCGFFFTLVATKGPLSVGRRARLFYTPNVIQPRSCSLCATSFSVPPFFSFLFLCLTLAPRSWYTVHNVTKTRIRGMWRVEEVPRKIVLAL